jgi:hypothetical protein
MYRGGAAFPKLPTEDALGPRVDACPDGSVELGLDPLIANCTSNIRDKRNPQTCGIEFCDIPAEIHLHGHKEMRRR